MRSDALYGYSKPRLTLENGELVAKNVPVPQQAYYVPWLTQTLLHLRGLRSVQLLQLLSRQFMPTGSKSTASSDVERNQLTAQVLSKVLGDLKRVSEARSSTLVVVYLSTFHGRTDDADAVDFWSGVLERESTALGIPFINLFEELKGLTDDELVELYLPGDLGHYSVKGNEYVAKLIYERVRTIPEVSEILFGRERPLTRVPHLRHRARERCCPATGRSSE